MKYIDYWQANTVLSRGGCVQSKQGVIHKKIDGKTYYYVEPYGDKDAAHWDYEEDGITHDEEPFKVVPDPTKEGGR